MSPDAAAKEARRDPRLDFFRGLGMFIILIAHIPWNDWTGWIPARFGHSDATEIFVFCSGAASAIAFLKVFETRGWWVGTTRIAYRIWQLYWCHIAIFFVVLSALLIVDGALTAPNRDYVALLDLRRFLADPGVFLPALFTLTYVPNHFDILVMYMVILVLVPLMAGLARITPVLAMGASVLIWAVASQPWLAVIDLPALTLADLSADPAGTTARAWFFNPFGWQLVFFTGFAFAAGWLPKPPIHGVLLGLAGAILLASFLMDRSVEGAATAAATAATPGALDGLSPLREPSPAVQGMPGDLGSKTHFGLLRYVHFLALAYLVWALAGDRGRRLPRTGIGGAIVTVVRRVGQQALAVFIASLLIAQLIGVFIAQHSIAGPDAPVYVAPWVTASGNLAGFALIILVAYIARFFRNPPWLR